MEEKHIVTVDLGTKKLGLSVAKIGKGEKMEIVCHNEFPSDGISHGKVQNTGKLSTALKHALESTEKFLGAKISQVLVTHQKYDMRSINISASMDIDSNKCIDNKDMDNLTELAWATAKENIEPGEEIFGIIAQFFDTDDEMSINGSDIIGMMSSHLTGKYKAFIGKINIRNFIDAAFRNAGYPFSRSEFVKDVTGQCVLTPAEMESGVALFDIGAGASSVSVFEGGILRHYGAIPFGGDSITTDIRNLCDISEELAENIKLGYGGCIPTRLASLGEKTLRITDRENGRKIEITVKYISEIITARFTEIIEALLYEIQKSGYANQLKNGIVLTGGCANTLNLRFLIKEMSGYGVRIGSPAHNLFEASANFFNPAAAESAGLVLKFIDSGIDCLESGIECSKGNEAGTTIDKLFSEDLVEDPVEEEKVDRKKEEAERKKQAEVEKARQKELEKERKRKEKEERKRAKAENGSLLGDLFGSIFGNDNDPANKL